MTAPTTIPMTTPQASVFSQFYQLTKPRVVQLIVFCALIGMALAVPGAPSLAEWRTIAIACGGIWLVAGAAAAFNCIVEKGIDAKMKRTAWRATAKGQLSDGQTLLFSGTLCVAGSAVLYLWLASKGHDVAKFRDYQFAPEFLRTEFHRERKAK